jgi:hypothetical protein
MGAQVPGTHACLNILHAGARHLGKKEKREREICHLEEWQLLEQTPPEMEISL